MLSVSALEGDLQRLKKLLSGKESQVDMTDSSGYTPLHYAARAGHREVVEYLIQLGADVNFPTRANRCTALHRASQQGHLDIVTILLKSGARADVQDADGCTPLHRAALAGDERICQLLKQYSPNLVHIHDNHHRLPKDCSQSPGLQSMLSMD